MNEWPPIIMYERERIITKKLLCTVNVKCFSNFLPFWRIKMNFETKKKILYVKCLEMVKLELRTLCKSLQTVKLELLFGYRLIQPFKLKLFLSFFERKQTCWRSSSSTVVFQRVSSPWNKTSFLLFYSETGGKLMIERVIKLEKLIKKKLSKTWVIVRKYRHISPNCSLLTIKHERSWVRIQLI